MGLAEVRVRCSVDSREPKTWDGGGSAKNPLKNIELYIAVWKPAPTSAFRGEI